MVGLGVRLAEVGADRQCLPGAAGRIDIAGSVLSVTKTDQGVCLFAEALEQRESLLMGGHGLTVMAEAVGDGDGTAAVGMGDLLMVLLWPLVATKAHSRAAGWAAALLTTGCLISIFAVVWLRLAETGVPAMILIGPAVLAHYLWLRSRHERERTIGGDTTAPVPRQDLLAALALVTTSTTGIPVYHAVADGAVVATGSNAGLVMSTARRLAPDANPILVLASDDHCR